MKAKAWCRMQNKENNFSHTLAQLQDTEEKINFIDELLKAVGLNKAEESYVLSFMPYRIYTAGTEKELLAFLIMICANEDITEKLETYCKGLGMSREE